MWWKKHKWKVLLPVLVVVILVAAFWIGGDNPNAQGWTPKPSAEVTPPITSTQPPDEPTEPIPSASDETSCTISISCATILENLDYCDPSKVGLVPEDGWVLEPVVVTFSEGESVFDVLQRVCREHKIHLEFVDTTIYDSAYIEGIANLYEFDVGELSGWRYSVNDWFPNYGSSRYQVEDGDVIEWVYTCDLGGDIGASDF